MKNITQSGSNDKGNILASKTKNSTINVDIKHSLTKDLVIFLFNYLGPHIQYPQTVFLQACLIAAFNSKGYMPLCSHQGQRVFSTRVLGSALTNLSWASHVALVIKNPPANVGDIRDVGLIPAVGRSSGEGHGSPLQYSCLKNPMDRGTWWTMIHRVTKSQTQLKWLSTCTKKLSCVLSQWPWGHSVWVVSGLGHIPIFEPSSKGRRKGELRTMS